MVTPAALHMFGINFVPLKRMVCFFSFLSFFCIFLSYRGTDSHDAEGENSVKGFGLSKQRRKGPDIIYVRRQLLSILDGSFTCLSVFYHFE